MNTYKILKVRSRYIVPFQVNLADGSFEQICKQIDTHKDYPYSFLGIKNDRVENYWKRESLRKGEQDVYEYILDEFAQKEELDYDKKIEKTGLYWHYQSFDDDENALKLKFSMPKANYDVAIVDMGLYVFRSGIGFLWYEIKLETEQITDSRKLYNFQNKIKELNRGKNNLLWIDREKLQIPKDLGDCKQVPFMLGNWIAERLSFLNVSFQAERKNSYGSLLKEAFSRVPEDAVWPKICPDKALLFTYAVFERSPNWNMGEDEVRTVYYLTNGYKESYEMGEKVKDIIRKPFANVVWMATREGCGYYAWKGEENGGFFEKIQYNKIMNDYFLLYIRTIYQSFSLMKYAVNTSEILSNDYTTYLQASDKTEEISNKISGIRAEISLFLVKSMATSVSHIQHQNDFYGYLGEQLQIKEDVASVTAGLTALNELQQETAQKKQKEMEAINEREREQEELREKEADNMFQIGLGLMTFLAVISAITDAYGIIDGLANNTLSIPWMIAFWMLFALCIGILIVSITIFIRSAKNLKHNKGKREGK